MEDGAIPERIRALIHRSGLSARTVSKLMGFKTQSGLQHYVDPHLFTKPYLPLHRALQLLDILEGKGTPPITADDVMSLAGLPNYEGINKIAAAIASMPKERRDDAIKVILTVLDTLKR